MCGITAYCRLELLSGCSCVQQSHTDRHVNVHLKCAAHIQSPFQGHICYDSRKLFRASKNKSCLFEWGHLEISNCLSNSQSNQQLPQKFLNMTAVSSSPAHAFVCCHLFGLFVSAYEQCMIISVCVCRAVAVMPKPSRPDGFTPRLSPSSVNYPQSLSRLALISSEEFPSMKVHQITSSLKRYFVLSHNTIL